MNCDWDPIPEKDVKFRAMMSIKIIFSKIDLLVPHFKVPFEAEMCFFLFLFCVCRYFRVNPVLKRETSKRHKNPVLK